MHEQAVGPLATVLDGIASALAEQFGVDRSEVTIGPVDFGDEQAKPEASKQQRRSSEADRG